MHVRKVAFQYATMKGLANFTTSKGSAGYYWLKSLMERKHLAFRKPEPLSVGRAAGMNKVVVGKWFDDLEKLMNELGIRDMPSHFWNCDETVCAA